MADGDVTACHSDHERALCHVAQRVCVWLGVCVPVPVIVLVGVLVVAVLYKHCIFISSF